MKGYKIFNADWTCRGTQYVVGETAEIAGQPRVCELGLHYCERALDCLTYYPLTQPRKFAEVLAEGAVSTKHGISATNKLKIVRELSFDEFTNMCTGTITDYSDDVIVRTTEYVKGVKHGPETTFFIRGAYNQYRNSIAGHRVYVDGALTGIQTDYYLSGNKHHETTYADNKKHGPFTTWSDDGHKTSGGNFKDNDLDLPFTIYNPDGTVSSSATYDGDLW